MELHLVIHHLEEALNASDDEGAGLEAEEQDVGDEEQGNNDKEDDEQEQDEEGEQELEEEGEQELEELEELEEEDIDPGPQRKHLRSHPY